MQTNLADPGTVAPDLAPSRASSPRGPVRRRSAVLIALATALFCGCSSSSAGDSVGSAGSAGSAGAAGSASSAGAAATTATGGTSATGTGGATSGTGGAPVDNGGSAGTDGTGAGGAGGAPACTSPPCCDASSFVGADGVTCVPYQYLTHTFPDQTTASGQEVLGLCRSWTLGNDTDLFVNTVHLDQNEGSHHSNFVFVPEADYAGPDGIWDCSTRSYDFFTAVAAGGVLYAQSTQAVTETQKFPDRVVLRVPAHSRIVSDIHLLDTTADSITGHATLTLTTIPEEQVKTELTAFHLEYGDLAIAPHADTRYSATCSLATAISAVTGKPYAPKLYYTLPHTHKWGKSVFMAVMGGPNDGEKVFTVGAYNGEAHGQAYDPPIDLAGSDGFTYGCEYQNSGDDTITWGFGSGEMCEIFGFMEASPFFKTTVSKANAAGTDNGVNLFTGTCSPSVNP